MPVQDRLLNRAISLYQAGDCETARRLFLGVLRYDESNQIAWIWYIETFPNLEERLTNYQNVLAKYPQMEQVRLAYQRLQSRRVPVEPVVKHTPEAPLHRAAYTPVTRGETQTAKVKSSPVNRIGQAPQSSVKKKGAWPCLFGAIIFILLLINVWFALRTVEAGLIAGNLKQENSRLETNYRLTLANLNQLQQDDQIRKDQLERMTVQNADLTRRFNELNQQYSSLNTEHQKLQNEYQSLSRNFTDLSNKAVIPPYIVVHQREVILAFEKLDHTTIYWSVPFENLEMDIERGYASRKNISSNDSRIKLTDTQTGKEYWPVDFRPYVDPGVFTKVISSLYAQAGSDKDFISEVWNIVTQLTNYAKDPEVETPRYPLETLLAGGGDCEDTSILFASMIKAAPVSWKISLVYMNADHPTDPSDPNHLAVLVDTRSAQYVVETTNAANMTPFENGVSGWFIDVK